MKMTVRQALESIYLNKKMAVKCETDGAKMNALPLVIVGTVILATNIKLKDKIDNHTKLSEEEKKVLAATPKMFKDHHITPEDFKKAMKATPPDLNPFKGTDWNA